MSIFNRGSVGPFRKPPILEGRPYGLLIIDGVEFPITEVRLADAQLHVRGVHTATERRIICGPPTVIGEDGRGICQGTKDIDFGEVKPGGIYAVTYAIRILQFETQP